MKLIDFLEVADDDVIIEDDEWIIKINRASLGDETNIFKDDFLNKFVYKVQSEDNCLRVLLEL